MTDATPQSAPLKPPRASSVSRQISSNWSAWTWDSDGHIARYPFPSVSQMGTLGVLVVGEPEALGLAATILCQVDPTYEVVHGGQWLVDDLWNGWLEVRRYA